MQSSAEGNLWCHTCKTTFRHSLDDNFDYKCPCGSEFIEELTNINDPRLFDNISVLAQQGTNTNRMDVESSQQSFSIPSRTPRPIQEIVSSRLRKDFHPDPGGSFYAHGQPPGQRQKTWWSLWPC